MARPRFSSNLNSMDRDLRGLKKHVQIKRADYS
jgi:hypothetical protein